MMAVATAKITQVSQNSLGSSKIALQAQQYAEAEANLLRCQNYKDLTSRDRQPIQNSDFESEINLSGETNLQNNIKKRIAEIQIYRSNEQLPRYKLDVPLYSVSQSGGCQIATATNSVSLTANGSYKNITVIVSSTFNPVDGSWTGKATFNIAAGSITNTVTTTTTTTKSGSRGHYWGTTENVVNQKTIKTNIAQGDIVKVSLGSASRHKSSTVTVILGN